MAYLRFDFRSRNGRTGLGRSSLLRSESLSDVKLHDKVQNAFTNLEQHSAGLIQLVDQLTDEKLKFETGSTAEETDIDLF